MTTIAPTQPARSGNPGIVPPWLQPRPVTPKPETGAPSKPVAPTPDPTAPDAGAADAAAGLDALGFVPLPDGRVVVVEVPDHHDHGHGHGGVQLRGARTGGAAIDEAHEQRRLEDTVADIQATFARLGIREEEGNSPVLARFNPRYPNASYAPEGVPSKNVPADSITVGMDPRDRTPFTRARDVVAHELAHRVIHHMVQGEMNLSPFSEDVAVHESLADTFAALVDDDEWVIGDELVEPIRVMDDPEQLGHPDHVEDLARVLRPGGPFMHPVAKDRRSGKIIEAPDWHVVAGIPNKAAALIGNELGRDTLGKIYIKAVREHVRPGREIEGLADAVLRSANELYGADSREFQVTRDAWDAVGVLELLEQPAATR